MARPADARKSAAWQRRLPRSTTSGTTFSNFCDCDDVLVGALHYWRRRLGQEQAEKVNLSAAPVFQLVDLLSERAVVIRFAAGQSRLQGR